MRPGVRSNHSATFNEIPGIVIIETVAFKVQPLVFNAEKKLPWGMPVIIYRDLVPFKDPRGFYPTGNCKTPAVEVDYRSSSKRV